MGNACHRCYDGALSRMCGSMQNNAISRIEGISHLNLLEKLYVGGNRLTLIDTLEFCPRCVAYAAHSPLEIAWTRAPRWPCLARAAPCYSRYSRALSALSRERRTCLQAGGAVV